ncbi:MAG: hypothetical protein DMF69_09145 [Acidobacteria bacterium]|nr:MAG: hypothetical protein DMF69_09145 [Acidobacteriota bacterium]
MSMRISLACMTTLATLLLMLFCSRLPTTKSSVATQLTAAVIRPDSLPPNSFTKAEYDQHIEALKKRLPSADFAIVVQPPFVVVGDEPEPVVKERAQSTIKWAVEKLKQDYFAKDPSLILDIWLFKDAESYNKHTRLIFNDKPTTPYGYYSRGHKALIMNIATGGGTLVHELVHPMMEANFPECPSWLNEGMGSLYEQCDERDGHIYGLVNWRLPGLQQAIKAGTVQSFRTLTSLSSNDFYDDDRGVNYAQSRYLCYYLQEKGLLVTFYQRFHAQQKKDPTGYQTLITVLGSPNMDSFQKDWEKFVIGLRN